MGALPPELWLFLIFLEVGCFSFGGAYSVWALVHQLLVQTGGTGIPGSLPPLPAESFYGAMEVGQLTPGPSISGVLLVGHYYSPYWGMAIALAGLLLPSVLAIVVLHKLNLSYGLNRFFHLFKSGALAAVVGILVFLVVQLGIKIPRESAVQTALFVLQVFIALYFVHRHRMNMILLTFLSGMTTWALHYFFIGGR